MIPQEIINLCKTNPGVICNIGPEQRPKPKTEAEKLIMGLELAYNTIWVDKPVMVFLKSLRGGEKVLTLIYWFPKVYTTVALEVDKVYWDSCGYPRLDLKYPKSMPVSKNIPEPFNGTVNIWGAFIVAIARMKAETEQTVRDDPGLDLFKRLINDVVHVV